MPYIDPEARKFLGKRWLETATNTKCYSAGELNYVITSLCVAHLGENPHYKDFNEVIGALECAKLELYRRMIAPYEDTKAKENGDVYRRDRAQEGR